MKTSIAVFVMMILVAGAAAGAETAATRIVDPYGIIIKPIPDKTVVLTFDDGCLSHATFVAPLLREYGFNATFYITEAMGFKSRKDWYMTWEQIKAVQDMGFEIGNHTVHHWGLSAHGVKGCTGTTTGMEDRFRENEIPHPTTFCWPMYRVNHEFIPVLAEQGYRFARGGRERVYDPVEHCPLDVPSFTIHDNALKKDPERFIKAAEQARDGKIAVFCFHGVPDQEHPQVGCQPETFRKMMSFLRENGYAVLAMRDMAQHIDTSRAALYLTRSPMYPWGGRALAWGWANREENTLYIGVEYIPPDRKLTLPGLTTRIGKAWFLADPEETPLPVSTSDRGISTIAVPDFSPDAYGASPVIIAAELHGGPIATILDFALPGLPGVTISGNEISTVVPAATDLTSLAAVYKTGSPEVTGKPASGTACDFSKPQTYTIRAGDGTSRTYRVKLTRRAGVAGAANPSFETFDALDRGNGSFGYDPKGAFWVFAQKHKNASVGIVSIESPHLTAIPPPDGSRHCGFVGGAGSSISQSVVLDEGEYTISFDRTIPHRVGGEFPTLQLTIDGRVLLTLEGDRVENGWTKREWKRYTSPAFAVAAGPHTIGFVVGDDAAPNNYALRGVNLIDNVRIDFQGK